MKHKIIYHLTKKNLSARPATPRRINKVKIATQFYLFWLCNALSHNAGEAVCPHWWCERALSRVKGATAHTPRQTTSPAFGGFLLQAAVSGLWPPFLSLGLSYRGQHQIRGLYHVQHKSKAVLFAAVFRYGCRIGSPSCLGARRVHARRSRPYGQAHAVCSRPVKSLSVL